MGSGMKSVAWLCLLLAAGTTGWAMSPLSQEAMAAVYGGTYTNGKTCVQSAAADCYPAGYDSNRTPKCQSVMLPSYRVGEDPNKAVLVRTCVEAVPSRVKRCTGTEQGKRCSEPACTTRWRVNGGNCYFEWDSNCQVCSTYKEGWGSTASPDPEAPLDCQGCTATSAYPVLINQCITEALPPA